MAVIKIEMFTVICDNCKKSADENTEYAAWNDEDGAKEVAMNANFIQEGENDYCPDCYSYDDNDVLVIKKAIIKKEFNAKGFQVAKVTKEDLAVLGSPGICDWCNNDLDNGTYIGALNHVYCDPCYEEWMYRAKFYKSDIPFETESIDRTLKEINEGRSD